MATLLLLAGSVRAQQATVTSAMPRLAPPRPGYHFPAHLTLTYSVDWRVFPAGTATFHLEQDGSFEHVTATSETLGAVNLIYKVVDRFESTFDRATGCSLNFSRQTEEGRRRVDSEEQFNYATGTEIFQQKNLVAGNQKTIRTRIPSCVTDDLSAIFYPASQDLQVGHSFGLPLADATRTVAVTMKVEE